MIQSFINLAVIKVNRPTGVEEFTIMGPLLEYPKTETALVDQLREDLGKAMGNLLGTDDVKVIFPAYDE